MEDLKESSDVLLIMFSGNLSQSVIVLGRKDSFLYSVLQDGIWKLLVWECRVCHRNCLSLRSTWAHHLFWWGPYCRMSLVLLIFLVFSVAFLSSSCVLSTPCAMCLVYAILPVLLEISSYKNRQTHSTKKGRHFPVICPSLLLFLGEKIPFCIQFYKMVFGSF
jgi:hypothetical protein